MEKAKNKKVLPVVKANAYGHGVNVIVPVLYKSGQRDFAVARYVEAENILKMNLGNDIRILVFESIRDMELIKGTPNIDIAINSMEEFKEAIDAGIEPSRMQLKVDFGFGRNGIYASEAKELREYILERNSMEEFKEAIDAGIEPSRMQLKVDFGFGRNGIYASEAKELREYILERNLKLRGIYTHLFAVNYKDGLEIIDNFTKIVDSIGRDRFEMIHLQNSAGVMNYDCEVATHIRVGMLTYGLQEVGYYDPNLRQVFSLEGQIAGVREVDKSKYVAYEVKDDLDIPNCKYLAKIKIGYGDGFLKKNEKSKCIINNKEFKIAEVTMDNTFIEVPNCKYLAKIKIGYGDGFLKKNEKSKCIINNKEFKIAEVTMDNTFIEVDESVKEGDKIYLYKDITKEVDFIGMNIYELLTILSPRIPRELKW